MKDDIKTDDKAPLSREKFLKGAAALAAAAATSPLWGKDHKGHDHHGHHHGHHGPKHGKLIAIANHCASEGQMCIDHCIELVKAKDTSIAACLETTQEMVVLCQGLSSLAAYDSVLLKDYAKLCMEACKLCEKECKVHAKKHAACKRCAESCRECIKACEELIA